MELILYDVEALHLGFAGFDALLVAARVERALDFQTGPGRRGADQLDHGKTVGKRPTTPVLRRVQRLQMPIEHAGCVSPSPAVSGLRLRSLD